MKKTTFPAIVLSVLFLSLLLPSCTELWGELDNPADPAAPSWQGYETVKDPDAIAPIDADTGVVTYVPTLLAGKVAGATAYQFRVSASADPEAYLYESAEVAVNEYLPVDCFGLTATTTYYWFVRAKAGGTWGEWSTETATFSLSAAEPGQVWPMTGMTSSDTTPLLIWEDFPDAVSYLVQIATTAGGLTSAPELSAAASEYQTTETLAVGNIRWWRVCAVNASSQQGPWTAAASFTIVPPPPPLLTPADASSSTSARPEFTWTAVDGAASYELAIATSEAGLDGATPVPVSGTSWTPASDLVAGTWYWRVRCVDAYAAIGEWGPAWSFERPYSIGDTGPAGGKVFYDKGSGSSGWRYLEAAPSDQSTDIVWWNGSYVTTGATATAIGTGEANTATIVSVQGAGSYAASLCANLTLGGFDDWFLPSKDELNAMYGQKGVIGGFASDSYWSSSEGSDYYAWGQYFGDGGQGSYGKSNGLRVRAIRAF